MPMVPESQRSLDKVFTLATPAHLLRKLFWEIRKLQDAQAEKSPKPIDFIADAYHAFNCAVTAWHLTDWIWTSVGSGDKAFLFPDNHTGSRSLAAFQEAIRLQCPALSLCQQLANSAKHMVMDRNAYPGVKAEATWSAEPAKFGIHRFGEPFATYKSRFVVKDGNKETEAVELFIEAFEFWRRYMEYRGLAEASAPPRW